MSTKRYTGKWESVNTHQVPKWYDDCKFGIFIHWGIYSVPAYAPHTWELGEVDSKEWFADNPYAEWYYNSLNIGKGPTYEHHMEKYGKDFKYEDFIPMWKAENWDPAKWAELFKKAGAQYVVLTTKHHDGFCLYPSKYTDFNCVKMGPKRDITGELTDAVRAEGIRMGLYYSGLIDWQYANDPIFEDDDLFGTASPTFEYADYSYKQMMELVDTYEPSLVWNDIGWPKQSEEMMPFFLAHYYNKVEEGVVNDRFNDRYHDFLTKEYKQGKVDRSEKWEMCRGMGLSFGYNKNEGDDQIISEQGLISLLVGTVANNGNLLINIGPKADGTIPAEQERRLLVLGKWLETNGEGIYETRCSRRESIVLDNGTAVHFTAKGSDLYVFVDGLKKGMDTVDIPNVFGELIPLDQRVQAEYQTTATGTRISLKNYSEDMYTLCFKAAGQE
ncbi:MAG: alpha-L-fucosidase [Blautia sp.]|uniref:alpha-L-fucosidase n=1 Tax=Blautia sp. TaxID=1955243 RepID=UPI002E78975B|nr:alpha-L-fucosidase [Blautia sp.]MED9882583.1 alpha-L-fucosidase [Blautia sp.]